MRHRKSGRKFSRNASHRRAMMRNLVCSLFLADPGEERSSFERIITTPEKAKEARRLAEKIITLGKRGTLAARRRALQLLGNNKQAVRKVFAEIAPRYEDRPGGYTRILHYPTRRLGDNAAQVIFELVEAEMPAGGARPTRPEVAAEVATPAQEPKAEEAPAAQEQEAEESQGEEKTE